MKKYYCESCGWIESSATHVEVRETTLRVGEEGEEVTVRTPVRFATATGEAVFDRELDNETLKAALELYRERHSFMQSEDLRRLRETYQISQRNLARLLGWSEATINRYESGAVPDRAHNETLRLLTNPCNVLSILQRSGEDILPAKVREELRYRLESLLKQSRPNRVREVARENSRSGPDLYTGYRRFSEERLQEMIVFFAQDEEVYKTKMNKLLWYTDFSHFRQASISVSGASYIRNTYGPTVNQYELHLDSLTQGGVLAREETFTDEGAPKGEKFKALRAADTGLFSDAEIALMRRVQAYFRDFTSQQISEVSHKEVAWLETPHEEEIPYSFAPQLNIQL